MPTKPAQLAAAWLARLLAAPAVTIDRKDGKATVLHRERPKAKAVK